MHISQIIIFDPFFWPVSSSDLEAGRLTVNLIAVFKKINCLKVTKQFFKNDKIHNAM